MGPTLSLASALFTFTMLGECVSRGDAEKNTAGATAVLRVSAPPRETKAPGPEGAGGRRTRVLRTSWRAASAPSGDRTRKAVRPRHFKCLAFTSFAIGAIQRTNTEAASATPVFVSIDAARAGNGTRTRDPNLGKVVLYQLSYSRERWDRALAPR